MPLTASGLVDLLSGEEKALIQRVLYDRFVPRYHKYVEDSQRHWLNRWRAQSNSCKKDVMELEMYESVIRIMTTTKAGMRSDGDKAVMKHYMLQKFTNIPIKDMNKEEIDYLADNIDMYPVIGKSIIFLQGDYGNCYYIIGRGAVGLYLEASKDKEMVIGREFGKRRACPYSGDDADLKRLGNLLVELKMGSGFGEFAILSTAAKIRSATAFSATDDTLLFILHAHVYNKILRKHHFRQRTLHMAIKLLGELPLFNILTYPKILQVVNHMSMLILSPNSTLIKHGESVSNVFIVLTGNVQAYPAVDTNVGVNEKRLPKLSASIRGRGCVIGEQEVALCSGSWLMTYVTTTSSELFVLPLSAYSEVIQSPVVNQSKDFELHLSNTHKNEKRVKSQLDRAYGKMKDVMISDAARYENAKNELMSLLPNIIISDAGNSFGTAESDAVASSPRSTGAPKAPSSKSITSRRSPRKTSLAVASRRVPS